MLAISKVCKHLGESFEQTKENIEGKVVVEEKVATTTEPIVVEQRNTYISPQQSTKSGFTVKWRMREAAVAIYQFSNWLNSNQGIDIFTVKQTK